MIICINFVISVIIQIVKHEKLWVLSAWVINPWSKWTIMYAWGDDNVMVNVSLASQRLAENKNF